MKKTRLLLGAATTAFLIFIGLTIFARQTVDVYDITMQLKVPQVVDNSHSLGKRVYKLQKITGKLLVYYDDSSECEVKALQLENLVNKSFKVGGKNVTYSSFPDFESGIPQIWNAIGNNKTMVFNKSSVCFNAELEPSYSLSQPDNDNSLILAFAGAGRLGSRSVDGVKLKIPTSITGYATGTQGCGCHDYGHISPTRALGQYGVTDTIVDIASVYGIWRAKFNCRTRR